MFTLVLLLFALALRVHAQNPIRVQHRVVHPNLAITPWHELGTVSVASLDSISSLGVPAALIPSQTLHDDLVQFKELVDPTIQGAIYQIALERPGVADGVWPTSVVKACYLLRSTSSHITIHFSSSGIPFAADHFVSPVPHDGSCPTSGTSNAYSIYNTTVTLVSPRPPPQPELRTPPPLTPEGKPIAPAPEKTFLQKYWIYVVVVVVVLLISGPVDEPAGRDGR